MSMISKKEFAARRRELMDLMEPNSIAIVPAAPSRTRSRDTEYPYRQDSDFFYLSGFPEPEAVLVLIPGREHGEFVLFCHERDRAMEIWNGYRAGPEGAVKDFGGFIKDSDENVHGRQVFLLHRDGTAVQRLQTLREIKREGDDAVKFG